MKSKIFYQFAFNNKSKLALKQRFWDWEINLERAKSDKKVGHTANKQHNTNKGNMTYNKFQSLKP